MIATAANDATLKERTWVLLTEATPGGGDCGDTCTPTKNWSRSFALKLRGFGAQGDEPSGRLGNAGGIPLSSQWCAGPPSRVRKPG
jgi:hypothetical protein